MTREEAMLRLGLDPGPLERGMVSSKKKVQIFGKQTSEIFRTVGKNLVAAFTVGAIIARLDKVSDKAGRIAAQMEKLGVSAEFVQHIESIGKASNLSADQVAKMMDTFQKKLAPGADLKAEFLGLADRIAKVEDPSTRATLAINAFGDSGLKMIPILAQGAEGIREFTEGMETMSAIEIKELEEAGRELQRFSDNTDVLLSRVVASWRLWASGVKSIWKDAGGGMKGFVALAKSNAEDAIATVLVKDMDQEQERTFRRRQAMAKAEAAREAEESRKAIQRYRDAKKSRVFSNADTGTQISMLQDDLKKEQQNLRDNQRARNATDYYKTLTKIEDIEDKIAKAKEKQSAAADAAKKKADESARKQKEELDSLNQSIAQTREALAGEQSNFQAQKLAEYMPTLKEIAESGEWVGRGRRKRFQQGQFAGVAQEIMSEEEALRNDLLMHGKDNINFDQRRDYIGSLKKQLSDAGLMAPQETMAEATKQTAEMLRSLVEGSQSIKVTVEDGE